MAYGTWTAVAWARYGRPRPERHPPDDLLDQFIPHPEVDEYHQLDVDASAPIAFAVAKGMDLQAAPIVKAIFWLRAVPTSKSHSPLVAAAGDWDADMRRSRPRLRGMAGRRVRSLAAMVAGR
jgi:hypothetical protein